MKRTDDIDIETGERRRNRRQKSRGRVVLQVQTSSIEGRTENVSDTGILFFSTDELTVTVQIEENGETRTRTGRIARAQRVHGDSFGWAVEFDAD
jgi:hypothetical protein